MKKLILFLFCSFVIILHTFAQQHDSEILELNSHYVVNGNKLQENTSSLIQINNRMGAGAAHVGLFYSKGEKLKIKTAQIEDLQGNIIRKLQSKEITDQNASSNSTMYSDDFVKHFELIHNTFPYRVRYDYEYERSKFFQIEFLNYAGRKIPLHKGTVIVEVPNGYPIQYTQKSMEEPTIKKGEKSTLYTWEFSYNTKIQPEISANYNIVEAPQLIVNPSEFKYGVEGGMSDWKEFGNWIFNLNRGRDILPASEKQAIDRLIDGVENNRAKIKILYNYLQDQMRYVFVKLDVGGFQTHSAEYVCTNRYGDCKALTNYMQSILKYAGIKSYYTLINSDYVVKDIDRDFPSQAFNHAILMVPIESDTLFLECTSKNIAFAYIPTSIQGRLALLVDENNSRLIEVPKMKIENVVNQREIVTNTIGSMNSSVDMKTRLRGYSYELYAYIKDNLNKNEVESFMRDNIMSGTYSLNNYKFDETDRNVAQVEMSANLTMSGISKKYGNNLSLYPFGWMFPNYETSENRKYELQIDFPVCKEDKIIYNLSNVNFEKIPQDILVESAFGLYSKTYKKEDGNLVVEKKLILNSGRYTLPQYADFYKFISQVKNNELTNIFLELL